MNENKEKARLRRAQRAALMNGAREQTITGTYNDKMQALAGLSEPWSNAACMGYCLIAMRRANLRPGAQRRVLMVLEQCFDDVSVEDAEKAGYANTEG